ncbi:MAG: GDSL-type esterase/lipase family protein [Planctomycetota bacterium]
MPGHRVSGNLVQHRRVAKLLLCLMVMIILPASLEIGSYLFGSFPFAADPLIADYHPQWSELRVYDPLLFWGLQPGLKLENIVTNGLGLRCPEIPVEKNGEFRILSLGESTTFGDRIRYEECYSARLEKALGQFRGKPLRVINAGVPGYSLFQGYIYLKSRGLELEPDGVLLYFGINDFLPVTYLAERDAMAQSSTVGLNDWELFWRRESFLHKVTSWISQHSNLVRGIRSLLHREIQPSMLRQAEGRVRVPPEHRIELLKRIAGLCRERGIPLIIIVPWYREFFMHGPLLREFAAEHGLPLVDLPEELADLTEATSNYFIDPMHPNAAGHGLIAEAIQAAIEKFWQ